MKTISIHVGVLAAILLATPIHGDEPTLTEQDRAALEIGRAIQAVDQALQYEAPDVPSPEQLAKAEKLTTEMVRIGQITRLYSWVSARIVWEIGIAEICVFGLRFHTEFVFKWAKLHKPMRRVANARRSVRET